MIDVFNPDAWSSAALDVLKRNIVTICGSAMDKEDFLRRQEVLRAEAARKRDAIIERLGHANTALRPIIALHSPTKWDECDGCDYSGYEGDKPDWPCRTIELILEGIMP